MTVSTEAELAMALQDKERYIKVVSHIGLSGEWKSTQARRWATQLLCRGRARAAAAAAAAAALLAASAARLAAVAAGCSCLCPAACCLASLVLCAVCRRRCPPSSPR